jgi:histidinol-phosphatase (PHP family)
MIYTDQHIHCQSSPDSHTPLREMAAAARSHGMSAVCFTDHIDMDPGDLGDLSWPTRRDILRAAWDDVRRNPVEGITVRCGIELGEANHDPGAAKEAALEPGLDFVLGSLHNLRGKPDFYYYPYESEAQCDELNRAYLAELLELTAFPYFDVMAHVGYTSRYMHRDGFAAEITAEKFHDELAAIYTALISQGRGIEINVSGLRCGHTSYPNASALALYKELGGEVITIGSDAHEPKDASIGIREGAELLRTLGFRYYAVFEQRKPMFVRL